MTDRRRFDVVIVGGGPTGLAAAWAAAQSGQKIGVVDDNPDWGGQIWRGEAALPRSASAREWFRRISRIDFEFLQGSRVFAAPEPGQLLVETRDGILTLIYHRLILATGARERFLPFPGWTLPNVMGAGGLQALVKGGLPIDRKRVIVAGSGPLLLAVAAYLRKKGATISLIAEQAPWSQLAPFGLRLSPHKVAQALALTFSLWGISYRMGCWPVSARGENQLDEVSLTDGRRTWAERCDYLACGFGLVPNVELAQLLGCAVREGVVCVDEWQQTTVPSISCAGEATGIGGLERSLVEGQIAGFSVVGRLTQARSLFEEREEAHHFAAALERAFALRAELRALPQPGTIVCRCEDVSYSQLQPYDGWRSAKLQTRCGMGPCQGRICGPAITFLRGWPVESVRPPVFPARLENLVGADLT